MTATSRATHRAAAVASPSESASRPRPVGSALAAFVAPWGFVVANTAYTIATWHGGSDSTGAESLALFGAHPTLARVAINAVLIGSMLIVPAVVGILRAQPRSRLANVGGWLMIFGYICYFGVLLSNVTIVAMAEYGGPAADFAAVLDAAQSEPTTVWIFPIFVLGNLVGTLLFAIGLLRSRAVGIWPAALIICWPPFHVVGLLIGTELIEVAGATLQAIGFAGAAIALLRGGRPLH
jgi:hypothetical protein